MMTRDAPGHGPQDAAGRPAALGPAAGAGRVPATDDIAGMIAYHLVDDIAERFLDLVDDLNEEIDELEDHVEEWERRARSATRLSALRHDMLHIRRTLAPTRDAVREVVDNRIEFDGDEVFTHDVELNFGNAYDKLLRAADDLELARDLVAGVRDYHQAKIANDQNEVMKRLTVIASILLLAHVHRRPLRPELRHHPRAALIEVHSVRSGSLGVGIDRRRIGLFVLIKWKRWL